jgi:eukaryotic-like serine/threonine-protein kinase
MKIDRRQWLELSELLDTALDLEPEQRDAWLHELSGENLAHREPLRTLLAQIALLETHDFLKTPDFATALRSEAEQRLSAGPDLKAGMEVGAYRLLREIGQGGMGCVWLAERSDGRFERQVALKFPYAGLHRQQLKERLRRERDILARLEHPNIARLYDADVTHLDQPFLVLEYVDGVPINDYCERHRLTVRDRVVLFLQVLNATRYAHSHLVIHRDLKPSNILITSDGIARLLDFGIAKLTSEGEARETALTQFGGRTLTPDYASPEQISGHPITTASDVYSLGVVLYELLTGSRPYRLKRDSRASLEDAIAEADVIAPSRARFTPDIAEQRAVSPQKLSRELRGDLDAIILKALQKNLSDRYASVDTLEVDLKHWLDGEVVEAQPPGTWYRISKLVGRHRLPFAAAGAVLLSLLAGAGVAIWQARAAIAQAERLQATKGFLVDIFNANSRDQDDPLKAQQTTARDLLDRAAARLDSGAQPSIDETEEMLSILGGIYRDLGLDDKSAALLLRRIALAKQLYGTDDLRYAAAEVDYAKSVYDTNEWKQALAPLQDAERILNAHGDNSSYTRGQQLGAMAEYLRGTDRNRSYEYAQRGLVLERRFFPHGQQLIEDLRMAALTDTETGRIDRAQPLLKEALAVQEREGAREVNLIRPLVELAEIQAGELDNAAAEINFRRGLEISQRINGEEHVDTIQCRLRLGKYLRGIGHLLESEAMLRQAEVDAVKLLGENESFHLPTVRYEFGLTEYGLGDYAAAADLYRRAIAGREMKRSGNRQHALMLTNYARLLTDTGHAAESERLMSRALEGFSNSQVGVGSSEAPVVLSAMYMALAKPEEAMQALDKYPQGRELLTPLMKVDLELQRAAVYADTGKTDEAEAILQHQWQRLQRLPQVENLHLLEAQIQLQLGRLLLQRGAADEARSMLEASLKARSAVLSPHSPVLADTEVALAECLLALGDRVHSRTLFEAAQAIQAVNVELGDRYRLPLLTLKAHLTQNPASRHASP